MWGDMCTEHKSDHGAHAILLKGTMTGMRQIVQPDTLCVPGLGGDTVEPHRILRRQTTLCTDGMRRSPALSQERKDVAHGESAMLYMQLGQHRGHKRVCGLHVQS
jgi:hypothetical protein